jgi:hypothetical protein
MSLYLVYGSIVLKSFQLRNKLQNIGLRTGGRHRATFNNEIGSRNVDQVSTLVNALIVLRFNTNITAAERSLYTWESEGKGQRNWQRIRIAYNFERFICSQPNQLTSIVQPYQIQ